MAEKRLNMAVEVFSNSTPHVDWTNVTVMKFCTVYLFVYYSYLICHKESSSKVSKVSENSVNILHFSKLVSYDTAFELETITENCG